MLLATAIRTGDRVVWDAPQFKGGSFGRFRRKPKYLGAKRFSGVVIRHSYGALTDQHTFSVRLDDGELKLVKGRNLYPHLVEHIPDPESKDRIPFTTEE